MRGKAAESRSLNSMRRIYENRKLSGATDPFYYSGSRERAVHAKNRILMPDTYCIKESKWKKGG